MNARSLMGAAFLAALALGGCSGGGGTLPSPSAPASHASSSPVAGGSASLTLSIVIPRTAASTASHSRRPAYVSPSTGSIIIQSATYNASTFSYTPLSSVMLNTGSAGCVAGSGSTAGTQTCTATVTGLAAGQSVGFIVNTYDGANGTGNLLATNQVDYGPGSVYVGTCPVSLGTANSCIVGLSGVPASYTLTQSAPFTSGVASSATLSIVAYDADGNTIVDPATPAYVGSTYYSFAGLNDGFSGLRVIPSGTHQTFTPNGLGCAIPSNAAEFFGLTCTYTMSYDGTAGHESDSLGIVLDVGYADLTQFASNVADYGGAPARFYPAKTPAACSGASSLTLPVPATLTIYAPVSLTNSAPTC